MNRRPGSCPLTQRQLIDEYFIEHRAKLLDLAAFLDRLDRASELDKVSPGRAVDMIEVYGSDRICVAPACDWGPSIPTAVPRFVREMRCRGHRDHFTRTLVHDNPIAFLRQSPKFRLPQGSVAIAAR